MRTKNSIVYVKIYPSITEFKTQTYFGLKKEGSNTDTNMIFLSHADTDIRIPILIYWYWYRYRIEVSVYHFNLKRIFFSSLFVL